MLPYDEENTHFHISAVVRRKLSAWSFFLSFFWCQLAHDQKSYEQNPKVPTDCVSFLQTSFFKALFSRSSFHSLIVFRSLKRNLFVHLIYKRQEESERKKFFLSFFLLQRQFFLSTTTPPLFLSVSKLKLLNKSCY